MTATTATSAAPASHLGWEDGALVITRVFPAPRALVWDAWTRAEHWAAWFCPYDASIPVCRMDARPGGSLLYCHRLDALGEDVWVGGVFDEVAAPERLSWTTWFADPAGNRVERPGFPREMRIAAAFADHARGTLVTIRHTGLVVDQGEVQGWMESLDRLATHVAASHTPNGSNAMFSATLNAGPAPASDAADNREAVATRVFHAPRALVFEAMTNPGHVRRWYGPRDTQLVSCEIDLRPGGRFRYVMAGPGGTEFAFSGVYREVVVPERVSNTWVFEPMPDKEAVESATWTEEDGRTTVTLRIRFASVEDYAGWASAGAFGGWAESLDRLAETLADLAAARAG